MAPGCGGGRSGATGGRSGTCRCVRRGAGCAGRHGGGARVCTGVAGAASVATDAKRQRTAADLSKPGAGKRVRQSVRRRARALRFHSSRCAHRHGAARRRHAVGDGRGRTLRRGGRGDRHRCSGVVQTNATPQSRRSCRRGTGFSYAHAGGANIRCGADALARQSHLRAMPGVGSSRTGRGGVACGFGSLPRGTARDVGFGVVA